MLTPRNPEYEVGSAEIIAFPGTAAASAPRDEALAQLRARIATTEAAYAPGLDGTTGLVAGDREPSAQAPDTAPSDVQTERSKAEDQLVRVLARSPKSIREAERFLQESAQLDRLDRERVVNRMIELNYLDDERLAEQLINGRLGRKGLGRSGLERELSARGIDREIISTVLADFDTDEEYEQALDLARERARKLHGLDRETARRRLYGYLARRGYSGGIVGRVVKESLD